MKIADTPAPPYYAVIFTSLKEENDEGYADMSEHMEKLVQQQPGYLGHESVRDGLGITVSYWENEEAILNWKQHLEHTSARAKGRNNWYKTFKVRVCKVERDYGFER